MARILIVEDDQLLCSLLSDFLEALGYDCTAATNAEQARAALRNREFHLVLSDFDMPGESGLEFLEFVLSQYPRTAGIMLTGSGDRSVREKALQLGLHAFISKPFSLTELGSNVANALHRH